MKEIEIFEKAKTSDKKLSELGINSTIYWAYWRTQEARNCLLDFSEVIWDRDIEEIVNFCHENKIRSFTISSTFSSLTETLWEFKKLGCEIAGMKEVNASYTNLDGTRAVRPAIIIRV